MKRLLINRNFALFWTGRAISNVGDFVFDTVLILWIATSLGHGRSWAALAVSGVLLAATIPTFALGPIAGVLADRWDKRRTMLLMDALRAGLIGLLVPIPLLAARLPLGMTLGALYAVVFLVQVCSLFFAPSRLSLLGDIVPERDRAQASSLLEAVSNMAGLVGPPLGPLIFFGLGIQWALIANALSFAASFLTLMAVRAPESGRSVGPGESGNVRRELVAGLQFISGQRVLVTIILTVMLSNLGWGALNTLNIFFLTQNLHTSASLFGLPPAASAVGAVIGALTAGMIATRLGLVRLFWFSKLTLGVLVIIYARFTNFPPALATFAVLGFTSAATEVSIGPIVLQVTPRDLIGRVSMVMFPAAYLTRTLSTGLAGVLDSTLLHGLHTRFLGIVWGPVDTIFTGAGTLILAGGIWAAMALRNIRLTTERSADGQEDVSRGGAA